MRGIWKDGVRYNRRDKTVHLRGINGRDMNPVTGFYGWEEMIAGRIRRIIQRQVHKGSRQAIKAEIPALIADSLWLRFHMADEIWLAEMVEDESRESILEMPFSSLLSRYSFDEDCGVYADDADDYDYGAYADY